MSDSRLEIAGADPFSREARELFLLFWNDLRFISSMNVLGLPAAVVPVGLHEGLPVGVQIVGSRYREDMCLDAAEAIERKADILTRQLWERR